MIELRPGDCREVIRSIPNDSIDSCCCDPPYALVSAVKKSASGADLYQGAGGFMGRAWDTGETVHDQSFWKEVLRVLKPGGHLVAFAGSRTYHRMAVAIEDAGFELRDMILELVASDQRLLDYVSALTEVQRDAFLALCSEAGTGGILAWVYGSGFPKSHDVSKAIDDIAFQDWLQANVDQWANYEAEMRLAGESYIEQQRVYQKFREISGTAREMIKIAPRSATSPRLGLPGAAAAEQEFDPTEAHREAGFHQIRGRKAATSLAQEWEGHGTALKPAHEPMVLARKPLIGTVAQNVLTHRTGSLNIDAARTEGRETGQTQGAYSGDTDVNIVGAREAGKEYPEELGRWPANVLHDESDEVEEAFARAGQSKSSRGVLTRSPNEIYGGGRGTNISSGIYGADDSGSASRFFFSAKASRLDRWGSKHPTVKPIDVMRWLVRLVTPRGGTVLDPFAGSGTTGVACLAEGMNCILIEREAEFQEDIRERLAFYEGTGRHSLAARNRNRVKQEKKGPLL